MKSLEFDATLTEDGKISLPAEIAGAVPAGQAVRVVVMWEVADDGVWMEAGKRRFAESYCPDDAVYEQLLNDAPGR